MMFHLTTYGYHIATYAHAIHSSHQQSCLVKLSPLKTPPHSNQDMCPVLVHIQVVHFAAVRFINHQDKGTVQTAMKRGVLHCHHDTLCPRQMTESL